MAMATPVAGRKGAAEWLAVGSAGVVVALFVLIASFSYPAIVFVGDAAPYYSQGVGMALVAAVILLFVSAATSSYPGTMACAQAEPIVVLAVMVDNLGKALARDGMSAHFPATMLVGLSLAVVAIGVGCLLLGLLRAGDLVRYMPYPVIAGFLAGIGWLLVRASIDTTLGAAEEDSLMQALQPGALVHWVPGWLLGLALMVLQRLRPRVYNLPLAIGAGIVLFWALAIALGYDAATVRSGGWLLGPFPPEGLMRAPAYLDGFDMVVWPALLPELPKLATATVVAAMTLLLTGSSLEIAAQRDIDLNRELRSAGIANLVAAAAGGLPGFTSLSASTLAIRLRAPRRATAVVGGVICLAVLLMGPDALGVVPKLVTGGILFYLGAGFIEEMLVRPWRHMPRGDYALLLLVFAAMVLGDFMVAVGIGLVAGLLLFAIRFNQIGPARTVLSGSAVSSQIERSQDERAALGERAAAIHVVTLHGYLFFGTAHRLVRVAAERLADPDVTPLAYLVLDFRRLLGIDGSALEGLARIHQLAVREDFEVLVCDLSPEAEAAFGRAGLGGSDTPRLRMFHHRDGALEWAENQLLGVEPRPVSTRDALDELLGQMLHDPADRAAVAARIAIEDREPGDILIHQGDKADTLLLVLAGRVDVLVDVEGRKGLRIASFERGTVVGEVAFYTGEKRTASVIAIEPTRIGRIDMRDLAHLAHERPDLEAAFHRFMAKLLAQRLASTLQLVIALER